MKRNKTWIVALLAAFTIVFAFASCTDGAIAEITVWTLTSKNITSDTSPAFGDTFEKAGSPALSFSNGAITATGSSDWETLDLKVADIYNYAFSLADYTLVVTGTTDATGGAKLTQKSGTTTLVSNAATGAFTLELKLTEAILGDGAIRIQRSGTAGAITISEIVLREKEKA